MGSRLSSALVQAGLLHVKSLESALARQAILGGELDTILLERGMVPESALTALLSQVTGFQPLTTEAMRGLDDTPASLLGQELGQKLKLCPLQQVAGSMVVLVTEATDEVGLEELAYETNRRLSPLVGPEVRLVQARRLVYGEICPERYANLLAKLGDLPPGAVLPEPGEERLRGRLPRQRPQRPFIEPTEFEPAAREPGEIGFAEERAPSPLDAALASGEAALASGEAALASEQGLISEMPPIPDDAGAEEVAPTEEVVLAEDELVLDEQETGPAEPEEEYADLEVVCTPLPLDQAIEAMESSRHRDDLLLALVRGAAEYLDRVQIYVRKGSSLMGHIEWAGGEVDVVKVKRRVLELERPSIVARTMADGSLYIGPVPDTDFSATILRQADLGDIQEVVLAPVLLKGRPICLVMGDRGRTPLKQLRDPLTRLAEGVARALASLIVSHKQQRAPEPGPVDIDELVSSLERAVPGAPETEELITRLLSGGSEAVEVLMSRFPGELRQECVCDGAPGQLASRCSPVLQALARAGRLTIPLLTPLLHGGDRELRYWATWLLAELVFPEVTVLLAGRLKDEDPAVRRVAALALRRFRDLDPYLTVVEALYQDLAAVTREQRQMAAEAVGILGYAEAVPALINLLQDPDEEMVQSAHAALLILTGQNIDTSRKGWVSWWSHNRERHRLEWLMDGLVHPRQAVREAAFMELTERTGMSFGYEVDLKEEERWSIRDKFLKWWDNTGITQFEGS